MLSLQEAKRYRVGELQSMLRDRGLSDVGNKAELAERLAEWTPPL
jgi:hypothetical protein